MRIFRWTVLCTSLLMSAPAMAQNWIFDARTIGLGGVGDINNVAANMVDEQRPYKTVVLPFGLFQVLQDFGKFNPTDDDFDMVRAIEYAASPIHYIIGRNSTDTGTQFMSDLRNGTLNRNLNTYAGFTPMNEITAEGLASPSWGGTIKFHKGTGGSFQGVYIGGGPYLSMQTSGTFDPALTALWASPTPIFPPNATYHLASATLNQNAIAITGGYRARMAWPSGVGSGGETEGLYIGANYHYLWGLFYQDFDANGRIDTNAAGLVTPRPGVGAPLTLTRATSSDGRGFALDAGVTAVVNRWELGFGVNGIANRMDWTDVEATDYVLPSLISGGDFVDFPARPVADAHVELPVDYRANATYNAERWTAIGEFANGFNGTSVRGGYEQRFRSVELRGGGRYVNDRFEPTGGVGFNLSDRTSFDVAAFGTSANIERERHLALAFSFRFGLDPKQP